MLKRRRTKKMSKAEASRMKSGTQILTCKVCGVAKIKTNMDTTAVTCAVCVLRMVTPAEEFTQKKPSGKPRGWHFKTYFEHEGKVYSKGVEITNKKQIEKLKNGITDVKPSGPKKTTKRKKNENNSRKRTTKARKVH